MNTRYLRLLPIAAAAALALLAAGNGQAASTTAPATINAEVGAMAKLTLSSNVVTFQTADPDLVPSISALEGPITVTVKARTGSSSPWDLQVKADDDLKSGSDVITIDKVSWVGADGFASGTMSKAAGVTIANGTGPATTFGTLNYKFANSFSYPTGNYSATIRYTLTAP